MNNSNDIMFLRSMYFDKALTLKSYLNKFGYFHADFIGFRKVFVFWTFFQNPKIVLTRKKTIKLICKAKWKTKA